MKKIITIVILIINLANADAQIIDCVTGPIGTSPQQITIDFTPPSVPCGTFISYEIWGTEDPNTAFSLIETILIQATTISIHDLASDEGAIWYYYIIFNYDCIGLPPVISNTATNEFINANIEVINVDIQTDPNGVMVTWEQSVYSQTVGYEIGILQANGSVIPIGTTNSISDTSFFDTFSLPANDIDYVISIVDGCGNPSSFNPNPYSQVLLDNLEQDRCGQLISLTWAAFSYPYSNQPGLSYNILVGNGPDTTVVANQALSATDLNFYDFIDGNTLFFRIEVVEADGTVRSTSEWRSIFAQIVQPPTDFFIEYLTVNDQNKVDVYFYIDTLAEIKNFKIKNSSIDITKPDIQVRKDDFDMTNKGNPHKFYTDTITNPNTASYFYQVVANDSCNEDHFSTKGKTIYLNGILEDFFLNKIQWNEFELENATISTYRLYSDYGNGMQLVETFLPNETLEYLDNVEEHYTQQGVFCYRMEADYSIEIPNLPDAIYTTKSNTYCLEQRPSVFIPNAIVPNGSNREFKPVIIFGNPTNYSMRIFNRWGALIFETSNPNEAWLGTAKNGEYVISGGYPYNISFNASDGTVVDKKGIVSVIY